MDAATIKQELDSFNDGAPSFYGTMMSLQRLEPVLTRAEKLFDKECQGKTLDHEEQSICDLLDELKQGVQLCKRWAGQELQQLPVGLTRTEKELAEDFLKASRKNLDASEPAYDKKVEMFNTILAEVKDLSPARESYAARKAERKFKAFQDDYNKNATQFEKWQAGKHKYNNPSDMQAAKRKYESGKKELIQLERDLEQARRERREEQNEESSEDEVQQGWTGTASLSTVRKPTTTTSASRPRRPAARAPVSKESVWDTANMTLMQKLRAQTIADIMQDTINKPHVEHVQQKGGGTKSLFEKNERLIFVDVILARLDYIMDAFQRLCDNLYC